MIKKITTFLFVLFTIISLTGCASNKANNSCNKTITSESNSSIVIYFSRTNNTEKIANYIVEITGAASYEILAKVPYTDDDINYNDSNSRTSKEQNDSSARPEIGSEDIDLSIYDVIYLGYPIWWGQCPKIMYTFIEKYDLTSKTIIPFCTSASSPIGTSATNLSMSASEANWLEGKRFSASSTKNDIEIWLKNLK